LGPITATVARFSVTDVSADALKSLGTVPDRRLWDDPDNPGTKRNPVGIPPDDWNPPFPVPKGDDSGINVLQDPALSGGVVQFTQRAIQPEANGRVLQLEDVTKEKVVPKLLAVTWPHDIDPASYSDPTPFLIYFHANVGQNRGGYYVVPGVGTYPFGYDYIHYGLWTYLNYRYDSFYYDYNFASYCMGLPYQIGATKNVVLVVPLSKVDAEVGIFLDAEATEGILLAIQDFFFKEAGKTSPGEVGRVALAGFSASNALVAGFLGSGKNMMTSFYKEKLKEVYLFDPPESDGADPPNPIRAPAVTNSLEWAKSGKKEDKMIRLYNQWYSSDLGRLVGQNMPNTGRGTMVSSSDNLRTSAYLPAFAWDGAFKKMWQPDYMNDHPYDDQDDVDAFYKKARKEHPLVWGKMHSWIAQTMLVDALRRSKF
jgi:hypothetical protein